MSLQITKIDQYWRMIKIYLNVSRIASNYKRCWNAIRSFLKMNASTVCKRRMVCRGISLQHDKPRIQRCAYILTSSKEDIEAELV